MGIHQVRQMLVEIIAVKASHSNRKNVKKKDIKED